MKKILLKLSSYILLFILVTFSNISFSQEQETEFKFTKDGFTDFLVNKVDSTTQSVLYKKTLDWISTTYKNPKEVLKAQIENDYIRIEGAQNSLLCQQILLSTICDDAKYQIEISFKDNRYKFDVISISGYQSPSQYSSGGWYDVKFDNMKLYFKDNGEIRTMYKNYPTSLPETFNGLNNSLKEFLMLDSIPSKKSDW
jgi:hypothetical protein